MENRKGVILQAHLDMVPQKNNDKTFDFEKDPIDAYADGGWVTADGTTLGADNGIGVASILAVLEDDTLAHGPLEALFTATEETGMDGAFGLRPGVLQGEILLNLDSEEEGELYVGCAGGLDANTTFRYAEEPTPAAGYVAAKISVRGLKGGHSADCATPFRARPKPLCCSPRRITTLSPGRSPRTKRPCGRSSKGSRRTFRSRSGSVPGPPECCRATWP